MRVRRCGNATPNLLNAQGRAGKMPLLAAAPRAGVPEAKRTSGPMEGGARRENAASVPMSGTGRREAEV